MTDAVRARLWLVAAAVGTVFVGLGLRFGLPRVGDQSALAFAADMAGSVMYAALWVVLLRLCFLNVRLRVVGASAFMVSTVVELFQLTDLPTRLAETWAPLALVFGTTFNAVDILGYLIGATIAVLGLYLVEQKPKS